LRIDIKIIAAMGVALLLASPAVAKTTRHYGSGYPVVSPYNEGGAYTPSVPTRPYGKSLDFQNSPR